MSPSERTNGSPGCSLKAGQRAFIMSDYEVKGSQAHYDAMVEFDQMCLISRHSLPCGSHTSTIIVATLGFP